MTALPTLRPATTDDVEAVAELWHRGWHDGHAGHVPDGLTAARTRAAFGERVPALVPLTTVAEPCGLVPDPDLPHPQAAVPAHSTGEGTGHACELAGFVVVVDDEVEQLFVAEAHRGSAVARTLLDEAERQVAARLRAADVRVEVDVSDDRMQKKIRNAQLQKVPFMMIAGSDDIEAGAVSFRYRDGRQENGVPVADAIARVQAAVASREQV